MTRPLLTYLFASLFNVLTPQHKTQLTKYIVEKEIPQKNCFGVFVTIRRNAGFLNSNNNDVHGCIGYWDSKYQSLTPVEIFKHVLRVGRSAMFEDQRRKLFLDICLDSSATIEIDFMMQPIFPINHKTGQFENNNPNHSKELFNNEKYGLIVTNGSNRATYLPKVFKSSVSWATLSDSLLRKAGNINNNNNNDFGNSLFFAYKVVSFSDTFFHLLQSQASLLQQQFSNYFFDCLSIDRNSMYQSDKLPYAKSPSGAILYDRSDDVRNIANMNDLIMYNNLNLLKLNKFINLYFDNIDGLSEQALAFMLPVAIQAKRDPDVIKKIKQKLLDRLPSAEHQFEYGELIVGLSDVLQQNDADLNQIINTLMAKTPQSIFQWNWQIQALASIKRFIDKNDFDKIHGLYWKYLTNLTDTIKKETNYYAVLFEGLCNLSMFGDTNNYIFWSFCQLTKRYDAKRGILFFTDKSARFDITCHMLNGFNILSSSTNTNTNTNIPSH